MRTVRSWTFVRALATQQSALADVYLLRMPPLRLLLLLYSFLTEFGMNPQPMNLSPSSPRKLYEDSISGFA